MALTLGCVKFDGARRAMRALEAYQELNPDDRWPHQVAVLERHRFGRLAVYGTTGTDALWEDEGASPATSVGAGGLTGLLASVVGCPIGTLVGGELGAGLGAVLTSTTEESSEPTYELLRETLSRDSSALLLLADGPMVDEMIRSFRPHAVDVVRRHVDEGVRQRLHAALAHFQRELEAEHAASTHSPPAPH